MKRVNLFYVGCLMLFIIAGLLALLLMLVSEDIYGFAAMIYIFVAMVLLGTGG